MEKTNPEILELRKRCEQLHLDNFEDLQGETIKKCFMDFGELYLLFESGRYASFDIMYSGGYSSSQEINICDYAVRPECRVTLDLEIYNEQELNIIKDEENRREKLQQDAWQNKLKQELREQELKTLEELKKKYE
ncbi:MAG: hypothetical protein GY827_04725 [Cytophagales bacterium]|nr:hypothetical protein [Cytophagales bacterium]